MEHFVRRFAVAALAATLFGCASDREVARPREEKSVKPGINKTFLDPKLDPTKLQKRFEGESREIYTSRVRIAGAVGLREGMAIADVGAGTGLFLELFAKKVGPAGKVYAVDIAPKLITFMKERIAQKRLANVETVLCTDRSVELPKASVDLVFVCDTYHHFEYPMSTMATIRDALRPGGRLVIVDFERIPGVSREWVLGHVRAGKAVVTQEIEAAGFRKTGETKVKGLRENYLVHFVRE